MISPLLPNFDLKTLSIECGDTCNWPSLSLQTFILVIRIRHENEVKPDCFFNQRQISSWGLLYDSSEKVIIRPMIEESEWIIMDDELKLKDQKQQEDNIE